MEKSYEVNLQQILLLTILILLNQITSKYTKKDRLFQFDLRLYTFIRYKTMILHHI